MAGVEEAVDMTGAENMTEAEVMETDIRTDNESVTAMRGSSRYNLLALDGTNH